MCLVAFFRSMIIIDAYCTMYSAHWKTAHLPRGQRESLQISLSLCSISADHWDHWHETSILPFVLNPVQQSHNRTRVSDRTMAAIHAHLILGWNMLFKLFRGYITVHGRESAEWELEEKRGWQGDRRAASLQTDINRLMLSRDTQSRQTVSQWAADGEQDGEGITCGALIYPYLFHNNSQYCDYVMPLTF